MKHINVAIFVPHCGCPNQCSFCNQRSISGKTKPTTVQDVINAVEIALPKASPENSEIAFFGGSFTAIDRDYMLSLLNAAFPYVEKGYFKGIRISTRPDCIDRDILNLLKQYGVTSIELGAQSMDDEVLKLNRRGHTAQDIRNASHLIVSEGFELGLQMMTGLYGADENESIYTADEIIKLNPSTVRIYPTVVLEETQLAELYKKGIYTPPTLESSVNLCAKLLLKFHKNNIKVIRLGLHSGGNVEDGFVAGIFHPAFRELCESKIYLEKALEQLKDKGDYIIYVPNGEVSKMTGQKKSNIEFLYKKGYNIQVKEQENLSIYSIRCVNK